MTNTILHNNAGQVKQTLEGRSLFFIRAWRLGSLQIDKINTKNLEPKILEFVNTGSFKQKAEQVARQMGKENFREEIYRAIIEE
jgi:ATP-dependent exoDNAse (exonuclease V) alpha subunit